MQSREPQHALQTNLPSMFTYYSRPACSLELCCLLLACPEMVGSAPPQLNELTSGSQVETAVLTLLGILKCPVI
jgi:hypothetical protein